MVAALVGITRISLIGAVALATIALGAGSVGAAGTGAVSTSQTPPSGAGETTTATPDPDATHEVNPPPEATAPAPTEPGAKPPAGSGSGHGPESSGSAPAGKPKKPKAPRDKPKKPPKKNEFADVPQAHSWAEQGITKLGVPGIDVSAWEHPDGAEINWKALRKAGVKWMYTKCSDGVAGNGDYTTWGPADVGAAEGVGIPSGCYHYAEPHADAAGSPIGDAISQARAAVAIQPTKPEPTLPLALDLEETLDLTNDQLGAWTKTFLSEVERLTGRTPWMYASQSYLSEHLAARKDLARYPIWVAAYSLSARQAPPVPTWANRVAWQFTSQGQLAGIPTDSVDLNVFIGDSALLRRLEPAAAPAASAVVAMPRLLMVPALPDVVGAGGSPRSSCAPSLGAKGSASGPAAAGLAAQIVLMNPGCY